MSDPDSGPVRVLLVDGDPGFGRRVAERIERELDGVRVETATDVPSAVDRLGATAFDCAVCGSGLPDVDGSPLLEAVGEADGDLPVVCFPAAGDADFAGAARDAGVAAYLPRREPGRATREEVLALACAVETAVSAARTDDRRFRALFEESRDLITVVDADGVFRYQSPSVTRMLGYDPDALVGENALDYVHPDDREAVSDAFGDAIADPSRTPVVEYRFRHSDGSWRWLESVANDLLDDPAAEGFVVNSRDVTERRSRERALRESRDRIEALHDAAIRLETCEDPGEIPALAVGVAEEILAFDTCVLNVEEDGYLRITATSADVPPDGAKPMSVDEGVAGKTYRTGESFLVEDVAEVEAADPQGPYRSAISVPVGDVGVFQAVAEGPGFFDEDDLELAELLVAHVAQALSRVDSERALRRERDRLAAFFENVPDPAVETTFVDDEPVVESVNPAFEAVFGYASADIVGESIDEFIVPPTDEAAESAAEVNRRLRAGERVEAEVCRETVDGPREFLLRTAPIVGDDVTRNYAIYTDITEQKEHERELGDLHATMRELIRLESPEDIAERTVAAARDILDLPHVGVFLWDEAAAALRPAATSARGREELGPPPTFDYGEGLAGVAFAEGEMVVVDDAQADGRSLGDGSRTIRGYCVVPLGEWGVLTVATPVVAGLDEHDVDVARILAANAEAALESTRRERELQERERELQRQNERLDEFASLVSHDLNNPLNVAAGRVELAREESDSEHLAQAEAALDRMAELIADVLTLARQGEVVSETAPVSLAGVVETARTTAGVSRDDLVIADDLPRVEADEERLRTAFENLFRNAAEHAGPEPTVTVGTVDGGFYVADDGPGVPPGERDSVFESGYSTAQDGTGFGLAIVKGIVDAHGWEIRVTDGREGGARFEVTGVAPATDVPG